MEMFKIVINIITILLCVIYGIFDIIVFYNGLKSYYDLKNDDELTDISNVSNLEQDVKEALEKLKKATLLKYKREHISMIVYGSIEFFLKIMLIIYCIKNI